MDMAGMIEMGMEDARMQLVEYQTIKCPTDEETAVIAGLMSLAAGKPLINLRTVIGAGGTFENGLPKLAVMDADARWCYTGRSESGSVTFSRHPRIDGRHIHGIFRLPRTLPEQKINSWAVRAEFSFSFRSQVPLVPPQHRPTRYNAKNHAILWEVEEWAQAPRPPGDPALLRHVTGDLYSVEAVWDLTPLEMAVLGARDVG